MLTYKVLNKQNLEKVLDIKHFLFPESNSDEDYDNYFNNKTKSNYYLIFENETPCAIIGWYDFDNCNKNAFVGWFGVMPEFRRRGIAKESLKFIINEVKKLGYEYLRVYTDKVVNPESILLYEKTFDVREDYNFPDKIGNTNNFVVFTKFLSDKKELWNNTPLNEDDNYSF